LDRYLQPVPIGITGALYIAGDGLARGYQNRPELTAEKFFARSFNGESSMRLYSTGDLARYRADGNIEFIGRMDNQVKIRGYRIELGEIESVLSQHGKVRESVVLAHEDAKHGIHPEIPNSEIIDQGVRRQLVAYIIPVGGELAVSELYNFLKAKLPDYMVPSAFVMVECFPLTPNGKVDRKMLSLRNDARSKSVESLVEPRTEIQHLVAQIWRDVLRLDRLGVNQNFFDLGGHSILAIQVITRMSNILRKRIPLRYLFDSPTIAGLAAKLQGSLRSGRK